MAGGGAVPMSDDACRSAVPSSGGWSGGPWAAMVGPARHGRSGPAQLDSRQVERIGQKGAPQSIAESIP